MVTNKIKIRQKEIIKISRVIKTVYDYGMEIQTEIYTDEDFTEKKIEQASIFRIDAKIIDRVENSDKKSR